MTRPTTYKEFPHTLEAYSHPQPLQPIQFLTYLSGTASRQRAAAVCSAHSRVPQTFGCSGGGLLHTSGVCANSCSTSHMSELAIDILECLRSAFASAQKMHKCLNQTHARTRTHTHACTCTHTHTHTLAHTHTHTSTHTHTRTHRERKREREREGKTARKRKKRRGGKEGEGEIKRPFVKTMYHAS